MSKPEQSFSIPLGGAELNITGKDYPNLETATLELNTGGIGTTEITISNREAKRLTRKHLDHHPNPMKHQTDQARETARSWAQQNQ